MAKEKSLEAILIEKHMFLTLQIFIDASKKRTEETLDAMREILKDIKSLKNCYLNFDLKEYYEKIKEQIDEGSKGIKYFIEHAKKYANGIDRGEYEDLDGKKGTETDSSYVRQTINKFEEFLVQS